MSEIPAKISDLGLVRRPLEDDEDAEQFKPLEWGLIRRMFTYARPVKRELNILLVLTVIRSAQLPALIWASAAIISDRSPTMTSAGCRGRSSDTGCSRSRRMCCFIGANVTRSRLVRPSSTDCAPRFLRRRSVSR